MMLLRSRHEELDKFRSVHAPFNVSWIMFFRTKPPGIHPQGVFFTEAERDSLTNEVSSFAEGASGIQVEPYNGHLHNRPRLAGLYGSR
jgi:hypothetical protein